MATTKDNETANTAVAKHADHDRVVMLSLKADGTPSENNPEIIGNPAFALDAAKRQFAEQAVSGVDVEERGVESPHGTVVKDAPQDPSIKRLQDKHEAATKAAHTAAEKVVKALHD